MPLIGFLSSLSCLYSWKAWVMPRSLRLEPLGHVDRHHHGADHLRRVAGRQHGHHPPG